MNSHLFHGKCWDLVAVILVDGDDSDDELADDGDDDVNDPDFTTSINEDDSDDAVSDLSNDDEQIPSGSIVQPSAKNVKWKHLRFNWFLLRKMTHQPFMSGIPQEKGFGDRDINNIYPSVKDFIASDELSTPFQYFFFFYSWIGRSYTTNKFVFSSGNNT